MKERRAVLSICYRDGSLLLDSRDFQKPARFTLAPNCLFPWEEFIAKLLIAWQMCDYTDVPPQFRPLKRIPQFVLDRLPAEPIMNKLKVLATLRIQGYFPPLPSRR